MMLRIFVALLSVFLVSSTVRAACTLDQGQPTPLYIESKVITIAADAPIDTSVPIAEFDTPTLGNEISYVQCYAGDEYGKRAINLTGQDGTTKIFQTNISGIGIKLLYSNGSAFGNFPSTSYVSYQNGESLGRMNIAASSFYRIQFFKTGNLRLNNAQAGDIILPAGQIGYNYMLNADPSAFFISLNIGEMKVVSTPVCTTDGAKTVDFNTVTPALLSAGVTRDLNFALVCKSDYGTYSAKASMTTTTPSADGTWIRTEDAAGDKDKLGIHITDGTNKVMKIDGTTAEQKSSITSQGPAEFSWKATLLPGSKSTPAGGTFNAKAEIVFDIQ